MNNYALEVELLSDATFGSGGGISTLINSEIQHDEKGLPTLSGRAIKGLLVNECSEILFVLPPEMRARWEQAALNLFGQRGEMLDDVAGMFIADATAAPDLVAAIHADLSISRQNVLDGLTTIRRQTAMSVLGAPLDDALRSVRVLVKGQTLYAPLSFTAEPGPDEKALLAACIMSLRRAGLNRTRGKGKISVKITARPLDPLGFSSSQGEFNDQAPAWFKHFTQAVAG